MSLISLFRIAAALLILVSSKDVKGQSSEVLEQDSEYILNKCSGDVDDTLEIPHQWITSWNKSNKALLEEEEEDSSFLFSLVENDPCPFNHSEVFKLHLNDTRDFNVTGEYFTTSGYFRGGYIYYPLQAYCVKNISEETVEIQTCYPKCGQNDLCFPKCCPPGKVITHDMDSTLFGQYDCREVVDDWSPFLYQMINDTHGRQMKNPSPKLNPFYTVGVTHKRDCRALGLTSYPKVPRDHAHEIVVLDAGHVFTRSKHEPDKGWQPTVPNRFCIDGFWDTTSSDVYVPDESNQVVWTCFEPEEGTRKHAYTVIQIAFILFCVSSFCLFIAVSIYVTLWSRQNIHGWTITLFCFAVMADWALFGAGLGIALYKHRFVGTMGCRILGVVWHFFHLSSFAWMTVLSYDMWTTLTSMTAIASRSKGRRRFALYCCYGYGLPMIVVAISMTIEASFPIGDPTVIRPEYGTLWCGLSPGAAAMYYGTVVTMILFSFNLIFAALFIKSLCVMTNDLRRLDESSTKQRRSMGVLFAKLFVLMGLSFVLDFTLEFLQGEVVGWLRMAIQFITIIRGVFIAYIFIFDPKIKRQLVETLYGLKGTFPWIVNILPRVSPAPNSTTTTTSVSKTRASRSMDSQF